MPIASFYTPWQYEWNKGSLMFSGGTDAATGYVPWKKVFLKISQKPQENIITRVSFFIKLQA